MEEEEKLEKEEKEKKKEPIKPILLVPEVDEYGHAVFKCINKNDAELVKTALTTPPGVKVKTAEKNTCPLDPDKPYKNSVCKKLNDLFKKAAKKAIEKEE